MPNSAFYYIDNILYLIVFCIMANGAYIKKENYEFKTTLSVSIPKGVGYCLLLFFTSSKISIFIIASQLITIFNFILSLFNVIFHINLFLSLDKSGHMGWLVGLQILLYFFAIIDSFLTDLWGKNKEYKKYKKYNKWQ